MDQHDVIDGVDVNRFSLTKEDEMIATKVHNGTSHLEFPVRFLKSTS